MTTIKTAISLEENLFHQADQLAAELALSRSRLIALALRRLIDDYETKMLVQRLDEAYANGPTEEDQLWVERAAVLYAETLEDEGW